MKKPESFTASLVLLGRSPVSCIVNQVSQSGVELTLNSSLGDDQATYLQSGAPAALQIIEPGSPPWSLTAILNQHHGKQVDLRYPGSPPPESNRLARLLSEQRLGNIDVTKTLDALERCAEKHARLIFEDFQTKVDETLFLDARDAIHTQDQLDLLAIRNQLDENKSQILEDFISTIRTQIRDLESTSEDNDSLLDDLSLVEDDNLATQLDSREIINTIYDIHCARIEKIIARFQELIGFEIRDEILPISPDFLCKTLRTIISAYEIPIDVMHKIYDIYQESLKIFIKELYEEFDRILADAGILPDLEISHRQALMMRKQRQEFVSSDSNQGSNSPTDSKAPSTHRHEQELEQQHLAQSQFNSPENLYNTVRNLMSISKKTQHIHQAKFPPNAPNSDELVDIISIIEQTEGFENQEILNGGVKEAITDHLSHGSEGYSPLSIGHDDSIELFENMFDAIANGNEVEEIFREKIFKLKTPFLKRVLIDETFFSSRKHPARILLNQLAFIGGFHHSLNSKTISQVDDIIEVIINAPPYDSNILFQKSDELQSLIDKQEGLRHRHIARVISTHEASEKLELAKHEVDATIRRYSSDGKTLPAIVHNLLDSGWRQHLLLTWINQTPHSDEWRQSIHDLRSLLGWFQNSPDEENFYNRLEGFDSNQLLEVINRIDKGIDSVSAGQCLQEELITALIDMMIESRYNPALVESLELGSIANITKPKDPEPIDEKDIRILKNIEINDWINQIEGSPRDALQLVWVSHNQNRFVLVDRSGQEHSTVDSRELARQLREGWQINKDDTNAGAVDRGIYATLQKVYQQLTYQRCHDELTGLINRKEFERTIQQLLDNQTGAEAIFYMLIMDIDQFNMVNNLCGHMTGDQLLVDVAEIIKLATPDSAITARIGGNEFATVIADKTRDEAEDIANIIRGRLAKKPVNIQEHSHIITASIGVSQFDCFTESIASIFRRASAACSMAKEQGRNRTVVYNDEDNAVQQRKTLEDWYPKITESIKNDALYLKVQKIEPSFSHTDGTPHYEVLLGLNDNEGIPIPIWQYIQAAEHYKKMQDVDRWVISAIFDWIENNPEKMDVMDCISINLSGTTVGDDDFLEFLLAKINAVNIENERICFEVTETAAIQNIEKAIAFMTEIKMLGCQFSLDDFGTGFSSYEYLKRLPVDYLKIDGVFVKNITSSAEDLAVVKSICEIGHFMNKKIIAEFVENSDIRDLLDTVGVDYVQGYGIEMPKSITEL